MAIVQTPEGHLWGHSDILNLDFCWEDGRLRWWDPVAERYLETQEQTAEAGVAAENRAEAAETQAETEREARMQAEARVRELEEELRRRRGP